MVLSAQISSQVLRELEQSHTTEFIIELREKANFSQFKDFTKFDEISRGRIVHRLLKTKAEETQKTLLPLLKNFDYETFWITNAIVVRNGTKFLVDQLSTRPEVAEISANVRVEQEFEKPEFEDSGVGNTRIEHNIKWINIPQVWKEGYNGSGIVVANIDTGVFLHQALKHNYRGNVYGKIDHNFHWFDGTDGNSKEPIDEQGHGNYEI